MSSSSTHERTRTGMSKTALKQDFLDNLFYIQGRFREVATPHDLYMAAAFTTRDRLLKRWVNSAQVFKTSHARTVCYLSAEYLLGPHLACNLVNLGITDTARQAGAELGLNFDAIVEEEEEPGLGNGGLGRLAACFMESLSTCQVPAIGYGIRYEFGIFDQAIEDGWQVEKLITGCVMAIPGKFHARRFVFQSAMAVTLNLTAMNMAKCACAGNRHL